MKYIENFNNIDNFYSVNGFLNVKLKYQFTNKRKILFFWLQMFKVYLCYKLITSQNVWSVPQVKNFVYFLEKFCSILNIFKFLYFNHGMNYQICDVMMSISTWYRLHFWIYLLNHNSLSHQTWPNDRNKQGQ